MDLERGPATDNYPSECLVEGNLMHDLGIWEKQSAAVQISMASRITLRHNTIYNVPRAGINISEGTWGGHLIEYNDVFNTVLETGDHGAFNSWGRDRYWHPDRAVMDSIAAVRPELITLDAVEPTVLRNNRWHCDHGWDIDLDDGSSNYQIYNNVCLGGGIKLREGFFRRVYNNIMVVNTFHPHVWFKGSDDVFSRNIVAGPYKPIRVEDWGRLIDYNLHPDSFSLGLAQSQGLDEHGMAGDPLFVDPLHGDYQVQSGSPAHALGFENFRMDAFGVRKPELKAIAAAPPFRKPERLEPVAGGSTFLWRGAVVKNLNGLEERSATGMADDTGVLIVDLPPNSPLHKYDLQPNDVILALDGKEVKDVRALLFLYEREPWLQEVTLTVFRGQQRHQVVLGKRD